MKFRLVAFAGLKVSHDLPLIVLEPKSADVESGADVTVHAGNGHLYNPSPPASAL
jgi:phosphohistidine swiveling domain-containing protein